VDANVCAKNIVMCNAAISVHRLRLGDVAVFENRQPVTAAKFINKSSLFILLLGVIRRLKLKPNSKLTRPEKSLHVMQIILQ
jgi:hypothetical protein